MIKKQFTLTFDSQGYAVWPEDAVLNINDDEVYDKKCEVRGIETLIDLLREVGVLNDHFDPEREEYKKGIIAQFDITVKEM